MFSTDMGIALYGIKEGMTGYGLDVAVSHCYGANAAHFFLVMLAYNGNVPILL